MSMLMSVGLNVGEDVYESCKSKGLMKRLNRTEISLKESASVAFSLKCWHIKYIDLLMTSVLLAID